MTELVGAIASGVTLAALFKACIEAFDLIQTSRNQEIDFKKLRLRLNIEKCRLYTWGESMGLTDTVDADRDRPIDRFRFPEVVQEILENVFDLFHDSHKIRDRYGCRQVSLDNVLSMHQPGPIENLTASFAHFSIRSSHPSRTTRMMQNLAWVIHDRKKFCDLVVEIKDLIDSLQGITSQTVPVARQEGKVRRKIVDIRDTETLSMIAEVCSDEHPDIADAASTKADTMSLASSSRRHVILWAEGVRDAQGGEEDRASPDLESLTVTELKHKVIEMMRERRGTNIATGSIPEPDAETTGVEPSSSLPSTSSPSIQPPSISTLLAAPPGDRMNFSLSQNQTQVTQRDVATVQDDQTLRPSSSISHRIRMSPAKISAKNDTIDPFDHLQASTDSSNPFLGHNAQGSISSHSNRPLVLYQTQYRKPSHNNDPQSSLPLREVQDFPVIYSASSVSASSNHANQRRFSGDVMPITTTATTHHGNLEHDHLSTTEKVEVAAVISSQIRVAETLKEKLGIVDHQCHALVNTRKKRCALHLSKITWGKTTNILREVAYLIDNANSNKLEDCLILIRRLSQMIHCKVCHQYKAPAKLQSWKPIIIEAWNRSAEEKTCAQALYHIKVEQIPSISEDTSAEESVTCETKVSLTPLRRHRKVHRREQAGSDLDSDRESSIWSGIQG
ncbi:MAG: hypothetical protein LQ342_001775 [Letrouitia transgressa]|nr:MAG: hypothetical protein LQ342_001775 [Letrouitia transgressa]